MFNCLRQRWLVPRRWKDLVIEKLFVEITIPLPKVYQDVVIRIRVELLLGFNLLELFIWC